MPHNDKYLHFGASIIILVLLLSWATQFLNKSPRNATTHTVEAHVDSNQAGAGAVVVEIRPCDGIVKEHHSDNNRVVFTCGKTEVVIENEHLIINSVNFGTIRSLDRVLVDNDLVFVNGKRRTAQIE